MSPGADIALDDRTKLITAYWISFASFLHEQGTPFEPRLVTGNSSSWTLGRGVNMVAKMNQKNVAVGVDVPVDNGQHPAWIDQLESQKGAIHAEMGFELEWREPGRKWVILRILRYCEMEDRSIWPDVHRWMLEKMRAVDAAFRPRVAALRDILP